MLLLYGFCSNKCGCRWFLGTTWGHMGHMRGHLGVQERPREGHVLQMLFFHWFYKHFQASREGASESFVIEVVGRRRQWAQNALFCNGFRRQKQSGETPTPLPPTLDEGVGALAIRGFEPRIISETEGRRPIRACGHKGRGPIYALSGCGPRPWYVSVGLIKADYTRIRISKQ